MGIKFADVPNGLAAIGKVPSSGWTQIVAFAGYYELFVYKFNGTPGDAGRPWALNYIRYTCYIYYTLYMSFVL